MSDTPPEIQLRGLTRRFREGTRDHLVLDGIDLDIARGETVALRGRSGSGKSTLLNLVGGIDAPDAGTVNVAGVEVTALTERERTLFRRERIGFVYQSFNLVPTLNVADNVRLVLELNKVPPDESSRRIAELLQAVGLADRAMSFPDVLSGGEQQRVVLGRVLAQEPTVLLLDEPLAALDRKLRKEMQIELKRIQREVGTTFLNVTHDQKEALSLSDRIGVMRKGKLLQIGTPNQIYEMPRTKFIATFMGATNIFPGRVVSKIKNTIELEIENGSKVFAPLPENFDLESVVGFSVHPELIDIVTNKEKKLWGDPQEETTFSGKIKEVIYQGDYSELTISLDHLPLNLSTFITRGSEYDTQDIRENQDVVVFWASNDNNVLLKD